MDGAKITETGLRLIEQFRDLSHGLLQNANRGYLRAEYLRAASELLLNFCGCDAVEFFIKERGKCFHAAFCIAPEPTFGIENIPCRQNPAGDILPRFLEPTDRARLRDYVLRGRILAQPPNSSKQGSFRCDDANLPVTFVEATTGQMQSCDLGGEYRSLVILPLVTDGEKRERFGILELQAKAPNFFSASAVEFLEGIAQILSVALAYRRTQIDLRERVKEMTCLYGIAQIVGRPGLALDDMLREIVLLLPAAWLYPEIAQGRIVLDDVAYTTTDFADSPYKMAAKIIVQGQERGVVEVVYSRKTPEIDEGPFLKDERKLIEAVAKEVALIYERKQGEEERDRLEQQLRHADRLATIGQLSAGLAHELNEPLGTILGFAQLTGKSPNLPPQVTQDLEKIVAASLYAREIIRKLMIFARQMPPQKTRVNLNQIVNDGLGFFETRCARQGIKLVRDLVPELPEIIADPMQINQILVNLVVNATQAMPNGGVLTVQTQAAGSHVVLVVADTGMGMSEEVKAQIFMPFFTTKEIGQGTGLGLSVVHGIVTAHGGTINVESTTGAGARFEIQLPVAGTNNQLKGEADGTI